MFNIPNTKFMLISKYRVISPFLKSVIQEFTHLLQQLFLVMLWLIARRPKAQIGESAYPVSPIGNFGTIRWKTPWVNCLVWVLVKVELRNR